MLDLIAYVVMYLCVGLICALFFEPSLRNSVAGMIAVIRQGDDDVFDALKETTPERLLLAVQGIVLVTWPGWVVFDIVARIFARLLVKKALRQSQHAGDLVPPEPPPPADRSDDPSDSSGTPPS